jgi:citrate synthase
MFCLTKNFSLSENRRQSGVCLKIGSQPNPKTAISTSTSEQIVVRGYDLTEQLVGDVSFTEHFFLLVTGRRPSVAQLAVLDATLVAIAEHGLVPSVQAARMTLAAAPEAFQGAVAAGLLGCGSVILGSAEIAGHFLRQIVTASRQSDLATSARERIAATRAERQPIPGYGHPLHKSQDPRVARLLAIASANGLSGDHVAAALAVEQLLPEMVGKPLPMNVSAAIPAILLDAGFPLAGMKGVPVLARAASLIAHLVEEQARPIGFVLSEHAEMAIGYDGVLPETLF